MAIEDRLLHDQDQEAKEAVVEDRVLVFEVRRRLHPEKNLPAHMRLSLAEEVAEDVRATDANREHSVVLPLLGFPCCMRTYILDSVSCNFHTEVVSHRILSYGLRRRRHMKELETKTATKLR